ncbi:MAG: NADH-quinone oxidoreductase subunit L, partial [Thermoplasmata archaeon]|nr:NADH-quinone oxidoreductase subunit L [Thermoplasmata archaeon]
MLEYVWLVPILPLVSFLVVLLFGRKLWQGGALVIVVSIAISFVLSLTAMVDFFTNIHEPFELILGFSWLGPAAESIKFGILVDNLTLLMLTLVSFLCLIITIYSIGYMAKEEGKRRYYAEISLFTAGMLGTVSANNYLQLLIFWEVMGLCSYLLIGFWYKKPSAASAAKKAFLVTRIGDVLLLVGIIMVYTQLGTFNFMEIAANTGGIDPRFVMLIPLLIFGGAVGKSAQFPLHVWLPDAMEGPTTVSALIHAATMVNAGVFLTARAFPLLVESPEALLVVAAIGGFTAIFAATMALTAYDIKKVLAYSTISQLGYMILALGAGGFIFIHWQSTAGYSAALFHLTNHAFFKALLFLGAGSVIHAVHTNDMRLMGGLSSKMKITSATMLIASISIAGIPPLSGFWSKDEILANVFQAGEVNSIFTVLWIMGIVTAFLTAFYMFRLWFMTFGGRKRKSKFALTSGTKEGPSSAEDATSHAHESPYVMTIPLIILAFFAFASGLFIFFYNGFENIIFFEHAHMVLPGDILHHVFTEP